eukprot:Skav210779  [mRNA]  locus=scaffold275:18957:19848:- [translate_table: standard]
MVSRPKAASRWSESKHFAFDDVNCFLHCLPEFSQKARVDTVHYLYKAMVNGGHHGMLVCTTLKVHGVQVVAVVVDIQQRH